MLLKTIISIITIFFSLIMIYITKINYKKEILTKFDYLIWNIVWFVLIIASVRPETVDNYFIENYQIDIFYNLSVVSIIALAVLYYINFIKIKIMEKKMNTIIRSEALKEIYSKINK
tara:strand:+ start:78 stop:428 length:351 start_codon:yes stop_codon:yes gene_type:complete